MGTRSSGKRYTKDREIHHEILERIKNAGTGGIYVDEGFRDLGITCIASLEKHLHPDDPIAEETVLDVFTFPNTGIKRKKKRVRLYFCSAEFYRVMAQN